MIHAEKMFDDAKMSRCSKVFLGECSPRTMTNILELCKTHNGIGEFCIARWAFYFEDERDAVLFAMKWV